MRLSNFSVCIILAQAVSQCSSFAPQHPLIHPSSTYLTQKQRLHQNARLFGAVDDHNNERTCVRQFLTQRSIQSFMYLMKKLNDPHTGIWIEDFLGAKNLLSYHGSGALDFHQFPEWDTVFNEMMDKPLDVVIVEIKAKGEGRGLSKNNPYRMDDEAVELEIDIDPPSLANRLIAVRDKIAKEWAEDLDLIISVNAQIIHSYNERNKAAREAEERGSKKNKGKSVNDDEETEEDEPYERSVLPLQAGNSASGDFNFGQRSVQSFERGAIYLMNHHPSFNDMDASPLRSSSFDLLFLLSMQESIHRVLTSYKQAGEEKDVSYAWFKDFYINGLDKYFDGNQSFGRADDFMDDLLNTPPALKTIEEGGDLKMGFIDPFHIAEDIISAREVVAKEWKEIMMNVSVDQEEIRKGIFRRQMEKWGQPMAQKTEEEAVDDSEEEVVEKKNMSKSSKKNKEVTHHSTIIIEAGDFE